MSDLYDADILEWSQRQAALLRRLAEGKRLHYRDNNQLDWPNIAGEIEGVGWSELHSVESLLTLALLHELKAQAWPLSLAADGWRADARLYRRQARRRFTPSMRQKIDLASLYADALTGLPEKMDRQPPLPVPAICPVTLDELLAYGAPEPPPVADEPQPSDTAAPPDWQLGDDSLTNLPEPVGTAIAEWRTKGWSDADIWAALKASEGAESVMSGGFALPRGSWPRALAKLRRRETVNRQRLSDTLKTELAATEADPAETSLPAPNRPERPAPASRRKESLRYAQDSDLDACIAHFAALSPDRKTDTATMRAQGVRWLRHNRCVKVTASALEDRLRSPEHADKRRSPYRPRRQ